MNGWWVYNFHQQGGAILLVSWIFWIIFSITLHELAHGWAAIRQGDDTPRRFGHMTASPLVHMGAWSLLMFALAGLAWGQMPVDPSRFRWRRKGRIVVAGAGPAMNLLLAFVALTAAALWASYGVRREPLFGNVALFLMTGGWLNIALALFNLLPIPPLDGASVLMGFSFKFYRFFQNPQAQTIGIFVLIAIMVSGVASVLFGVAMDIARGYVFFLKAWLP